MSNRLIRSRFLFRICFIIFILFLGFFAYRNVTGDIQQPVVTTKNLRHLSKLITVVFRQFEEFDNDVADSVQSFVAAFPNMPILVISKNKPYPPFPFSATNETLRNVKVVLLDLRLNAGPEELNPLTYISSEFVLFVPDSTRVSRKVLQQSIQEASGTFTYILAVGVGSSLLVCQQINWNYADWTLKYDNDAASTVCDAVQGQHGILIKTSTLKTLPQPFMLPFPEAFYLQTSARKLKVKIQKGKLAAGRSVLKSPSSRQRAARHIRDSRIALYKQLGVKLVSKGDERPQWYGCRRETQRCFPSVQGVPSFVLAGRNTPPCCRRNIKKTISHVLQTLVAAGARCWLETTSLLGAVLYNDILPYIEYGEIGIHVSDIPRVSLLSRGGVDQDGYVWEKATRGSYYRVAYSTTNRVYVLILPFVSKNGTMAPADWVMTHQKEFPERHLHPLAQIPFVDSTAPAPNDARAFLDHKLGRNSLENCQKKGPKFLYT